MGCIGGKAISDGHVGWQQELQATLTGFRNQLFGDIDFALFKKGIADLVAFSFQEGIGHATADQQNINHADQALQHRYLV